MRALEKRVHHSLRRRIDILIVILNSVQDLFDAELNSA